MAEAPLSGSLWRNRERRSGSRSPAPASARPAACPARPALAVRPPRRARPPDGPARPRSPLRPPGPGPQEEALTQQRGARELSAPGGFQPPDSSPAGACGRPELRRPRRRPGELRAGVEGWGEGASGREGAGEVGGRVKRGPAARQRAPPSAPRRRPRQPGKGRTDGRREAGAAAGSLASDPSPRFGATVPPSGSAACLEVTAPGGCSLRWPGAGWVAAAG